MDLRERLAAWLAIRGVTRADLARACKVTPAAVTAWLHPDVEKRSDPTQTHLDTIVKTLGLTHAEFYGAPTQPPPATQTKPRRAKQAAA